MSSLYVKRGMDAVARGYTIGDRSGIAGEIHGSRELGAELPLRQLSSSFFPIHV